MEVLPRDVFMVQAHWLGSTKFVVQVGVRGTGYKAGINLIWYRAPEHNLKWSMGLYILLNSLGLSHRDNIL